jgi:hypothetical protein
MSGTTNDEDLYEIKSATLQRLKLPWMKLIGVPTDTSQNLTARNIQLLNKNATDTTREPWHNPIL